ncbi:hypothetical protein SAMN05444143_11528 [Flavobacterium succinicans]|jgi:hypothetical protein|uniref:Uncharacterized protein n=2 Tax=Flavobacteriaceae TaxID=49546 RepID=A0A1I4ZFS1_9FLAO|nr:hypothetical protein SAMN05444143_11528 [Flavobacterium succinicans]
MKIMDASKIIELASYTLPAIITGVVAYQFFNLHTKNEDQRRRYLLHKEAQKTALPLRLQAYERMTLFLERISLNQLLIRIAPISAVKTDYEQLLIAHIEQELEHNLTQQIYMSEQCWSIILTAKNATNQMIRVAAQKESVQNAEQMREVLLNDLLEKQSPSHAALAFIKNEVGDLW